MPPTIELGPFAIASERLWAIMLIWVFIGTASLIASRKQEPKTIQASWISLFVGVIVARLSFVVENMTAFRSEPASAMALWQGGFSVWPGVVAAAVALFIVLRYKVTRWPMLALLSAIALVHGAASATLLVQRPQPLPQNIMLTKVDGTPVPLRSLRGQPYVINLWATWCPPCRRELPMLADVAARSHTLVLLVNQGESAAKITTFMQQQKLSTASVMLDYKSMVSTATDSSALPTTLFIDRKGNIRRIHVGEISRATLLAGMKNIRRDE